MKRKLIALLMILALALVPAFNAAAVITDAWRLEDVGMTIKLPSNWEAVTRGMNADDSTYASQEPEFYAEALGLFEALDTLYMCAIDTENFCSLYVYVEDYSDGMDYRTASDEYMEAVVEEYKEYEMDSVSVSDAYVREVDGLKYTWAELESTQADEYLLQTETALNGVYYQTYMYCWTPIDDTARDFMYGVLKSTSYDTAAELPGASPEPTPEPAPEPETPESAGTAVPESEAPHFDANAAIALAAALLCAAAAVIVRSVRKKRGSTEPNYCACRVRSCTVCGARVTQPDIRCCPRCGTILPVRRERSCGDDGLE